MRGGVHEERGTVFMREGVHEERGKERGKVFMRGEGRREGRCS